MSRFENQGVGPYQIEGLDDVLWRCPTCRKGWIGAVDSRTLERVARKCSATDRPCEVEGCDGRVLGRTWQTHCEDHIEARDADQWAKAMETNAVEVTFPCVTWKGDRYFYSECVLEDWMEEEGLAVARLSACEPVDPPPFEMTSFLDCMVAGIEDDVEIDDSFDAQINELIRNVAPSVISGGAGVFEYRLAAAEIVESGEVPGEVGS